MTVALAHPGAVERYIERLSAAGAGVWSIARVNTETGEIAGVFETIQPSDTDLGAKEPKEVKITGIWYGLLEKN